MTSSPITTISTPSPPFPKSNWLPHQQLLTLAVGIVQPVVLHSLLDGTPLLARRPSTCYHHHRAPPHLSLPVMNLPQPSQKSRTLTQNPAAAIATSNILHPIPPPPIPNLRDMLACASPVGTHTCQEKDCTLPFSQLCFARVRSLHGAKQAA